jgi:hypothetical protein
MGLGSGIRDPRSGFGIRDPGSGKPLFRIPDPGVKILKKAILIKVSVFLLYCRCIDYVNPRVYS